MSATCAADAPVKTFKDALDTELIVGASNDGATTATCPLLLNNVLGTKFKHRHRLSRQPRDHARARTRRGPGRLRHRLDRHRACCIRTGSRKDTVQRAGAAQRQGPSPTCIQRRRAARTLEFARNDDDRKVMELIFSQGVFGRPYVLPPGVPAERVAALRKAFMAAFADTSAAAPRPTR